MCVLLVTDEGAASGISVDEASVVEAQVAGVRSEVSAALPHWSIT